MELLKIFSVVILTKDVENMKSGSIGTIVEVYNKPAGYTVEFIDKSGYTIALLDLSPNDVRLALENEIKK